MAFSPQYAHVRLGPLAVKELKELRGAKAEKGQGCGARIIPLGEGRARKGKGEGQPLTTPTSRNAF